MSASVIARRFVASRLHAEQARCVAAEDRDLLLVAERRGGEDVVHRMLFPRDRMVGAEHDLARADLGHKVAQRLGREHQRIEIELVEIFGRLLLELDLGIAVLRRHEAGVVGARCIRSEIAAAMRGNDLQAGEAVEGALEDQVLKRDRGVERIADGVRQPTIALEALAEFRRALGMNEEHGPELLGLGPDRMEALFREILAQNASADGGAAQTEILHRVLELRDREVRILQGERGKGGEAIRM